MAQHGHLCMNPAFVHLYIFTLLKYSLVVDLRGW